MPRLPYAAQQLIAQVEEAKPRSKAEPYGDPDGIDVYRTIRFSKSAAKWLHERLDALQDERIESLNVTDSGYLHVTFVPDRRADYRTEYDLEAVDLVLSAEREDEPVEEVPLMEADEEPVEED